MKSLASPSLRISPSRRGSVRLSAALPYTVLSLAVLGLLLLLTSLIPGCGDDQPVTPAADPAPNREVARIAMDGGTFLWRPVGATRFEPWKGGHSLPRGATIRTQLGSVMLNFMNTVQVQLYEHSELILQGDVGKELVLGLKKGKVLIHSTADPPVVVKMPHGEVRGIRPYVEISGLERGKRGYTARVKSLVTSRIVVANIHEAIDCPPFAVVHLDEERAPRVIRQERRPGVPGR